jgi:hypothetical protein
MQTTLQSENLKGRDYLGGLDVGWENNVKMDLKGIKCQNVDKVHLTSSCDSGIVMYL